MRGKMFQENLDLRLHCFKVISFTLKVWRAAIRDPPERFIYFMRIIFLVAENLPASIR